MSSEIILGVVVIGGIIGWLVLLVATVYREYFGWSHVRTTFGEEPFAIEGIDVWSDGWLEIGRTVKVKDPEYGELFELDVFETVVAGKRVLFASGETSNNVYRFYRRRKDLPRARAAERTVRY